MGGAVLIFAKDIRKRDHHHAREEDSPELKAYMDYQRKLFPYTVVRAGLDFAYKEIDDILLYMDNGNQPPPGAQRETFPEDIPGWFKFRFPWTGAFMTLEDMHGLLVKLIKAMDSFRTLETANTWHWAVLYDTTHNIVEFYNEVLRTNYNVARDIHLSNNIEVLFDDFINNYWPHLDFMVLSKPDYPHARLLERNAGIEAYLRDRMAGGASPLPALEEAAAKFQFHPGALELLRRDSLSPALADLAAGTNDDDPYSHLYEPLPPGEAQAGLAVIDAEYTLNHAMASKKIPG